MKFEEFPFMPALQKGIAEIGFVDCTPVQEQSFQAYFGGKDIYAQSQTGTGKTAAFMLCGMQELARRNEVTEELPAALSGDIKMLILSPTRELAEQIEKEASLLAQFFPVNVAAFYGGVGYEQQRAHLDGGVQIITGTPGRIIDLAKSGELPLHQVYIMVLDEADRMLDMGFVDDVRWIMSKLPSKEERLTMLFSATLNARVGNLTWEFMRSEQIAEIIIEPEQITTENVEQEIYHVGNQEKLRLLLSLIKKHDPESALIFCNTKSGASFLEGRLRSNGYQAKALMGDLAQVKRNQIIGQLKAGKLRFVVATDVASRGLHIEGLPLVINYDLPDEAENYVHRIGRTARAGATGRAISMACQRYVYNLVDIERYIEDKIPVAWFPEEDLVEDTGRREGAYNDSPRDSRGSQQRSGRRDQSGDSRGSGRRDQSGDSRGSEQRSGRRDQSGDSRRGAGNSSPNNRNERPRDQDRVASPKGRSKSSQSKEERLRYYQEKYGEDFGVEKSADSKGSSGTNPRERNPRGKNPRGANSKSSTSRGAETRTSNGKKANAKQARRQQSPQNKGPGKKHSESIPAKKPSFLQKLFGKK